MPEIATEEPDLLPFVRPRPTPYLRVYETFIVGDRVVRFIGERWFAEDLPLLDVPAHLDPSQPGKAFSWRLVDMLSGDLIRPASDDDLSAFLALRSPRTGA